MSFNKSVGERVGHGIEAVMICCSRFGHFTSQAHFAICHRLCPSTAGKRICQQHNRGRTETREPRRSEYTSGRGVR